MAPHHRITVKGALDDSWSAWFDGLAIAHDADGDTMLEGAVRERGKPARRPRRPGHRRA